MNNDLSAPFSALLNVVCYDLGSPGIFTFKTDIDPTRVGSAYFNYPGNIYTAKWDDNTANYVTSIQDIIDKSGLLTHPYSESSCGKNVIASGQTIYNSFGPSMTVAVLHILLSYLEKTGNGRTMLGNDMLLSFMDPTNTC